MQWHAEEQDKNMSDTGQSATLTEVKLRSSTMESNMQHKFGFAKPRCSQCNMSVIEPSSTEDKDGGEKIFFR